MAHPQTPAPQQPARPRRFPGALMVVTLVVAVLALVVALAGVVLSAIALGRSDKATDLATKANNQVPPAIADPPTTEPATDPATPGTGEPPTGPGPATSPTDISPTAQFTVAYEGEHLRVRSDRCGYNTTYLHTDLDEPRIVGGDAVNTEFGYAGCDPGNIAIGLPFAQVSGPSATPQDCLETIRTDPGRSPIAPTRGMTLCIVTNQNAAAAQAITQKLVFVTVDSVSVDNNVGVLNITAKAWAVPQ